MILREVHEPEQIVFGRVQQRGYLRGWPGELRGDLSEDLAGLLARGGREDLSDRGGDHRLVGLRHMPEHVAQKVAVMPTSA